MKDNDLGVPKNNLFKVDTSCAAVHRIEIRETRAPAAVFPILVSNRAAGNLESICNPEHYSRRIYASDNFIYVDPDKGSYIYTHRKTPSSEPTQFQSRHLIRELDGKYHYIIDAVLQESWERITPTLTISLEIVPNPAIRTYFDLRQVARTAVSSIKNLLEQT